MAPAGNSRSPASLLRAILKAHRAETELNDLSDRDLRDIGVHRPQIAELVRREATRDLLLQAGWPHQPVATGGLLAFDDHHGPS